MGRAGEGRFGDTTRIFIEGISLKMCFEEWKPGCPGVLAQHHSDIAQVFGLGREVMTFRTPREASRIARDLTRHPAERREIGRRARALVLREHTWAARLPLLEAHL